MNWKWKALLNEYKKNLSKSLGNLSSLVSRRGSYDDHDYDHPMPLLASAVCYEPPCDYDDAFNQIVVKKADPCLRRCDYFWMIKDFNKHFQTTENVYVISGNFKLCDPDGLDVNFSLSLYYNEKGYGRDNNITIDMIVKYASSSRLTKAKIIVMDESEYEMVCTTRNILINESTSMVKYCASVFDADLLAETPTFPLKILIVRMLLTYHQDQERMRILSTGLLPEDIF